MNGQTKTETRNHLHRQRNYQPVYPVFRENTCDFSAVPEWQQSIPAHVTALSPLHPVRCYCIKSDYDNHNNLNSQTYFQGWPDPDYFLFAKLSYV